MAEKLRTVGTYRILYAQPTPETGEKLAVALLVQDVRRNVVYFDRKFPRLRKVLGDLDLNALEFYLDDLNNALTNESDPDQILNKYAPQVVPSDSRKVALPLDDKAIQVLIQKLLRPASNLNSAAVATEAAKGLSPVTTAIKAYMRVRAQVTQELLVDVTPERILGRRVSGLHSVALGVQQGSTWVLVDGVDLNELTPNAAIKRADEVARNFWHLNREAAKDQNIRIRKIGLVLNGNSHLKPATLDAHDYSLHRLEADADRTFDGASIEAPEQIRREVLLSVD